MVGNSKGLKQVYKSAGQMQFGVLLLPILGGYWFLIVFYHTRYKAVRDTGYHLFFKSAITGSILFVIAFLIVNSTGSFFTSFQEVVQVPDKHLTTSVLSALLGGISPFILNLCCDKKKAARKAALDRGDRLELMMARSFEEATQPEISLRSNKCYVGYVVQSPFASHGATDVEILPTASGYREQETRELRLTTDYFRDFLISENSPPDDLQFEDFIVVLPMSEVISTRVFNLEMYDKYFRPNQVRSTE